MSLASDSRPPTDSSLHPDRDPSGNWNDIPSAFSRSPHPYRRSKRPARARSPVPAPAQAPAATPYLPSPALTPYHSDSERARHGRISAVSPSEPASPSESGTEADDEALKFTKALPAPPLKPRKGLRTGEAAHDDMLRITPSPKSKPLGTAVADYFGGAASGGGTSTGLLPQVRPKQPVSWERTRRICETLCLLAIASWTIAGAVSLSTAGVWQSGLQLLLLSYGAAFASMLFLYPLRLAASGSRLSIPPQFDPAPLLYPPILPVLTAASLSFAYPSALLPNVILGLSALPARIVPNVSRLHGPHAVHWLLSLSPLVTARIADLSLGIFGTGWVPGQLPKPTAVTDELLTLLFPLHQTLLPQLRYLTASSLLPSESQLLSVALINVLLLAESPQMVVWKYIVWIGGFGLLALCHQILKWNVALERVPVWRFRKAGHAIQASRSFLSTLADGLQGQAHASADDHSGSDAEGSQRAGVVARKSNRDQKQPSLGVPPERTKASANGQRKRGMSTSMHFYLSMTHKQALLRKVCYTAYTYLVMIGLVLGPIRSLVASNALQNSEPFGWAIGYVFGDLDAVRSKVLEYNMEHWITLAPNPLQQPASVWVDGLRYHLGSGNARLLIFGYFAVVLGAGIGLVLLLSTSVEVDTRRKVFHGTMVALLLPTAFVDPEFLSLGLILVLTAFLLLEVLRAAQIRPLSKPLARFLAPYVDGRDLRGPVVVSHVFLLIGCAIPFWLSLAGIQQPAAERPWKGWEAESRDVSMVAGVVCVGMGDAAASLVGRRFGRHKWPWRGGKSLEGSAAFAVAVAGGLAASKAWLRAGQWRQSWEDDGRWTTTWLKAAVAGAGASLCEAVLTGCNDNVVVPVLLWLLVRGVKL